MLLNFEILPSKLSSYDKIRGLREETPYHSKGWFFYLGNFIHHTSLCL